MITSKTELYDLSYQIIGSAIEVHKHLGPGLLESIYHSCMIHELTSNGIKFKSEYPVPVIYKGLDLKTNLRCDLIVEDTIVVELKSVESLLPIHDAQLLTYMSLLQLPKGLMFNFNSELINRNSTRSLVNKYFNLLVS